MANKNQAIKQSNNPFPGLEEEILNFWDKGEIFKKSLEKIAPKGNYIFYDGPPFATGEPHYGHIVASIMKDAVPRYWTMRGFRVERRWGWDCHGLPVENLAEKELGFKNKQDIEKMGVAKFNDYCKSIVLRYAEEWKKTIKRIGRWVDMEHDYKTMDSDYMETIWWVFKTLWDKKLVYRGYKAMHICPRCGTTLSNFEVTQNYKEIKDLSATVKFELEDEPGTFVLAWTTTPWTLIGNVALAVNEKETYIKFRVTKISYSNKINIKEGDIYILLESAVGRIFGTPLGWAEASSLTGSALISNKDFSVEVDVLERPVKIKDLVGKKYKPLFDYYSKDPKKFGISPLQVQNGWRIYAANFVNTEEGTGIVHIAPAFGEDDMKLGQEKNLPFIQHVDGFGRFTKEVRDWPGEDVKPMGDPKKTDKKIIEELDRQKKIFSREEYEHSYPHCWRCETPLLNYAAHSWFVKVTAIKDDLIKNNQKILWVSGHIKDGRFGKWLDQARDWAISRNRYWGATLPVWICDKCEEKTVVGSREELKKLSGQAVDDLHKQYVDEITWPCSKCGPSAGSGQGGIMKRIPEVFDCWFESGAMPYGQEHYPFSGKKYKNDSPVPADFIAEGIDQTRGWFYTMMVLATALFNAPAAENIIANGIVLAENGQKMSKRLKNYPDPSYIFEHYGVDAMRYYLFASPVMKSDNINFSEKDLAEQTRFLNILLNVLSFYKMFASGIEVENLEKKDLVNVLDKWVTSRLEQTKQIITDKMDNYDLQVIREIPVFIDDLSTWYVNCSRNRFKGEDVEDKMRALKTLRRTLYHLARIMAPFLPFMAEHIYRELGADVESVHLKEWPEVKKEWINEKVLEKMKAARIATRMGLSARDAVKIKVKQPLSILWLDVKGLNFEESDILEKEILKIVKDKVNVKEVFKVSDNDGRSAGRQRSGAVDSTEFSTEHPRGKNRRESNYKDGDNFVSLSIELTSELIAEGTKREIVRQVNAMRKQAGLTIKDKIILSWQSDSQLIKNVFTKMAEELKRNTLTEKIVESEVEGDEVKVNGESVRLGIKKI